MAKIALVVVTLVLAGALSWVSAVLRRPQYNESEKLLIAQVLYNLGYRNELVGLAEVRWDVPDPRTLDRSKRELYYLAKTAYDHGRQDAREKKPNLAEEIQKNRQEQIHTLDEMIRILRGMRVIVEDSR